MNEQQATVLMLSTESSNKTMMDMLSPLEMRMGGQIDNLTRDSANMRGYLSKINEIMTEIANIDDKLKTKMTADEIDEKFEVLKEYVTVKQYSTLQRIVSQKAEGITLDEQKIQTD